MTIDPTLLAELQGRGLSDSPTSPVDSELEKEVQSRGLEPEKSNEYTPLLNMMMPDAESAAIASQTMPGRAINALDYGLRGIANVGQYAQSGFQQAGNLMQTSNNPAIQTVGKYLPKATNFLLPQNRVGAALTALPTLANPSEAIPSIAGNSMQDAAQVGTKVVRAGPMAQTVGAGISTTTAIPQRYASAVAADPTILSESTPSISQVGQGYKNYFNKIGANFNTKTFQKWSNQDFWPDDRQMGVLKNTVAQVKGAMESGEELKPEDLFLGRAAASTIARTAPQDSTNLISWAKAAKDSFDSQLEQGGQGELKELGRQYFRASAKEQFQSLLPQNKNLSPNALRSIVMLNQARKAIGGVVTGNYGQAASDALSSAAMSPLLMGKGIQSIDSGIKFATQPGSAAVLGNILGNKSLPSNTISGQAATKGILTNYQASPTTPQSMERKIRDLSNPNK